MDVFDELGLTEETEDEFKIFDVKDFSLPGGCPEELMNERLRMEAIIRSGEAAICKCCSQNANVYRRPITKGMSKWLIKLVHHYERTNEWFEINKDTTRGGDYAKLMYWAMIVRKENNNPAKRTSGFWKPTKRGIDFAYDRIALPKKALVYASNLLGFSPQKCYCSETFKTKDDYRKLIAQPLDTE